MKPILSPRELAQAIGVSESSLKRWADDGLIRVMRTAGGHRRITIAEAVRFIRQSRAAIVRPDVLGLADLAVIQRDDAAGDSDADRLERYLVGGHARQARAFLMSMYLSGQPVAAIVDGPVRTAMERLGRLWQHDERGVFLEHRAAEICASAIMQLQAALSTPEGAPAAVGGAPPGDPYLIASLAAATVLMAEGFHAVNLGANTPIEALLRAAEDEKAALVWLSIGATPGAELRQHVLRLSESLAAMGARLIVGGFHHHLVGLAGSEAVFVGQSMAELAAFAKGLLAARGGRGDGASVGSSG